MTSVRVPSMPLTPKERRARNRQEMVDTIIAASRGVLQEHGASALNLNEVARRVKLRPQSLAEYFPTKASLYDALYVEAMTLFRSGDERAYREHPPGWEQIEAWFANRIALAEINPDLHHLGFDAPVPDYIQAKRALQLGNDTLVRAREMVAAAIAAGAIAPDLPIERATDVLLSIRHGLIAERLGKRPFLPPGSERFHDLLPDVLAMLRLAWAPKPRAPDNPRSMSTLMSSAARRDGEDLT
jgi:AcrR family transcriptional regulator